MRKMPRRADEWLSCLVTIILKDKLITILAMGGVLLGVYWGVLSYVDYQLSNAPRPPFYQGCNKIWSNRGLVTEGIESNSIESVQNSFAHQATGVEIDHFYDPETKRFIVSHDFPYNLRNNQLLTLQALFQAADSPDHYYWLDFKKLGKLERSEVFDAIALLEQITRNNNLKTRIYVEGEDPFHLAYFKHAGFNTIFDTHPIADRFPLSVVLINLYKMVYYFGGYSVFALNYSHHGDPIYTGGNKEALKNVPVFLYHLPEDPALIETLVHDPAVKVMLNNNHSLSNFHLSACE